MQFLWLISCPAVSLQHMWKHSHTAGNKMHANGSRESQTSWGTSGLPDAQLVHSMGSGAAQLVPNCSCWMYAPRAPHINLPLHTNRRHPPEGCGATSCRAAAAVEKRGCVRRALGRAAARRAGRRPTDGMPQPPAPPGPFLLFSSTSACGCMTSDSSSHRIRCPPASSILPSAAQGSQAGRRPHAGAMPL